jgi:hypothetical protein
MGVSKIINEDFDKKIPQGLVITRQKDPYLHWDQQQSVHNQNVFAENYTWGLPFCFDS